MSNNEEKVELPTVQHEFANFVRKPIVASAQSDEVFDF